MHIKRQISILIITLLILPLACMILFPMLYYAQAPDSMLMKIYWEIRDNNPNLLSSDSWDQIEKFIETKPRDIEVLVIHNGNIIFSTFNDFKEKKKVNFEKVFEYLKSTFSNYDYNIQSFYIADDRLYLTKEAKLEMAEDDTKNSGIIITRRDIHSGYMMNRMKIRYMLPFYMVIVVMEIIFVISGFITIKTISNSVIRLKLATENIISGNMDTPVDTRQKKIEADEISGLAENLETMRLALKENAEKKTRFIMGISHDLRTPVALIKGYSEAIEDGIVKGEGLEKSVKLINQNAIHLEEMINDLINYVKLNNTDWKQKLESVKLKPQLEIYLSNMKGAADLYKRKIIGNINIPDDIAVKMDSNLFQRVIENLFNNALRYSSDGDTISLNSYMNEEKVPVVSIKDTGKGIEKKDQEKVFELFYRGSSSRRENGMGIGLAVVKTIVDSHGWKIDLKSEAMKGTEFIITLNG